MSLEHSTFRDKVKSRSSMPFDLKKYPKNFPMHELAIFPEAQVSLFWKAISLLFPHNCFNWNWWCWVDNAAAGKPPSAHFYGLPLKEFRGCNNHKSGFIFRQKGMYFTVTSKSKENYFTYTFLTWQLSLLTAKRNYKGIWKGSYSENCWIVTGKSISG